MDRSSGFAEVGGARLYYETAGAGPPVVFVHGFTLDRRMWDDQVDAFASDHLVVRYDARGFGRSSAVGEASFSSIDDLKGLLDCLHLSSATLVGLSMGGGIASAFAAVYPEVTRALVLVDPNLWGYQWSEEWNERMRAIGRAARGGDLDVAKRLWLAHPLFAPASESPALAERLRQMVGDWSGWHWLNRDPERGLDPPTSERLAEIRSPTLVVVGERDLPDFQRIADRLTDGIPDARKVVLPGVGHLASMEAPEAFNRLALDFLGGQP